MQNIESSLNNRFWLDSPLELRFLGLMVSLAFIVPYHLPPIASFYSEFVALIYGLLAVGLFIFNRRQSVLCIPKVIWLPIGIGSVVVLQWSLGMFAYQSSAVGLMCYMLWVALLMMLGASMMHQYEPAWLVLRLAWFVLCGALVNAVAGIIQLLHWGASFGGLVMPMDPGQGIFGNLGQQNHYATHMAMGLLSTGVLFFSRYISKTLFTSCLLLFCVVIVMSGSRMGLLYMALISVVFWTMYGQRHEAAWANTKKILCFCLVIAVSFGLAFIVMPAKFFSVPFERWTHIGSAFSPRVYLWENALEMFRSHPILGVGFDDFAYQLFHQAAQSRSNFFGGLDKSAHNIFFHLLAVSGVLGFIAFVWSLTAFIRRQFAQHFTLERIWLLGILGILSIHSFLEQPLFYAYFLGVSAIVLGLADEGGSKYKLANKSRLVLSALPLALTGLLLMAGWDYVDFSRQQKKLTVTNPASFTGHTAAKSRMIELGNRSFLAPYVELNYANFFISPETSPAEKLIFSKRVLRFSPIPEAQIRHSLYLFENGEVAQSVEYFAKCASLYPEVSQRFIAELSLHPMGYEKWLDLVKGK